MVCRVNTSYQLGSAKVVDTVAADSLGPKTAFCRCWKSKKFPLCDGGLLCRIKKKTVWNVTHVTL